MRTLNELTACLEEVFASGDPEQCALSLPRVGRSLTNLAFKAFATPEAARFCAILVALLHHPAEACRRASITAAAACMDVSLWLRVIPVVLRSGRGLDPARRAQAVEHLLQASFILLSADVGMADRCRTAGGVMSVMDVWRMSHDLPGVLAKVVQLVLLFARAKPKSVSVAGGFEVALVCWQRYAWQPASPASRAPGGDRGVVQRIGGAERHTRLMDVLFQLCSLMLPHVQADKYMPLGPLAAISLRHCADSRLYRSLGFLLHLIAKLAQDPSMAREMLRLDAHAVALSILDGDELILTVPLKRGVAAAWSNIISGVGPRRVMSTAPRALATDAGPLFGGLPCAAVGDAGAQVLSISAASSALGRLPEALPPGLSCAALGAACHRPALGRSSRRCRRADSATQIGDGPVEELPSPHARAADDPGADGACTAEPALPGASSTAALRRHLAGMLTGRTPHGASGEPPGARAVYPLPPGSADDPSYLRFSADFEEGNLRHVVALGPYEYEVQLAADLRNPAHCQWFCWSMTRMQPATAYTFHIVNVSKPSSLFEEGAQPHVLSRRLLVERGIAWKRMGQDVAFYANGAVLNIGRPAHTVSFSLVFPFEDDECLVSHFWMYTLSDLRRDLLRWTAPPGRPALHNLIPVEPAAGGGLGDEAPRSPAPATPASESPPAAVATPAIGQEHFRLMQTPAGYPIDAFRVGSKSPGTPTAILVARAHPGEVPASWIMRGVCDFLLIDRSPCADRCRQRLSWVLVPMLNPDGVVAGNTRTNMSGVDLNRHHHDDSAPETVALRALFASVKNEGATAGHCPLAFVDIHGHSRRRGVFMMGNAGSSSRLPRLLEEETDLFDFAGSAFYAPSPSGRGAGVGRVAAAARGCPHSFTLESSFGMLHDRDVQLQPCHLQELGRALCLAVCRLTDPEEPRGSHDEPTLAVGRAEDDDG